STTNVGGGNQWRNPLDTCQVRRFGYGSAPLTYKSNKYSKENLALATNEISRHGRTSKRHSKLHQGNDLEAALNSPVYAVCKGRIVFATSYSSYGNSIILQCNVDDLPVSKKNILRNKLDFKKDIVYFIYCHLNKIKVDKDELVEDISQPIGLSGNSGNAGSMTSISKGSHLHFEVRDEVSKSLGATGLKYRYDPFPLLDNCSTIENGVQ
ncbi:M23 family metallopeptidase, partial [Psychrobacter glaciei]